MPLKNGLGAKTAASPPLPSAASIKDAKRNWPKALAGMEAESHAVMARIEKLAKAASPVASSLKYRGTINAKRRLAYAYARFVTISARANREAVIERYLGEMLLAPNTSRTLHAVVGKCLDLRTTEDRRVRSEYVSAIRFLISHGAGPGTVESRKGSIRSWAQQWHKIATVPANPKPSSAAGINALVAKPNQQLGSIRNTKRADDALRRLRLHAK
jgi:hypothetical protein